jgi:hypothetical protein
MSLSSRTGAFGVSVTIGVVYDSIEDMVREEEAKKGQRCWVRFDGVWDKIYIGVVMESRC